MNPLSKYRRDLAARNFEVTPNQRATHMHILERAVPLKRDLEEFLSQLRREEALDREEAVQISDTIDLIQSLCYPMALLNVVEDPKDAAARAMFSRHLQACKVVTEQDEPEEEDDTPSFRP